MDITHLRLSLKCYGWWAIFKILERHPNVHMHSHWWGMEHCSEASLHSPTSIQEGENDSLLSSSIISDTSIYSDTTFFIVFIAFSDILWFYWCLIWINLEKKSSRWFKTYCSAIILTPSFRNKGIATFRDFDNSARSNSYAFFCDGTYIVL